MAAIATSDIRRIISAFTLSHDRFLITNRSLLVLMEYVTARLDADPDGIDQLVKDSEAMREAILKDSKLGRSELPGFGLVPVMREDDSYRHTSKCPNYPRI